MLHGLGALVTEIESRDLDEAAIYRRERLYRLPTTRYRPGALACPVCGTTAARFLPFGLTGRRQAQCPTCGSAERHRMLWLFLQRHTALLTRRLTVLHTAPEPCLETRLRPLPNWRYLSVDRFNPNADLEADLTDLPLPAGVFDLVISSHVLEHVPDDCAAMAELARVLRRGGEAVILVPFDPSMAQTAEDPAHDTPAKRMAAYGHPYHYRIYGADLVDRLGQSGLSATVVSSKRLFTPHERRRFRINRNYLLHCRRR